MKKGTLSEYKDIFAAWKTEVEEGFFGLKKYLETDMEFHRDLLKPIGNRTLDNVMQRLYEQNARYRMACTHMRNAGDMLDEHLVILKAVEEKNQEGAVKALKQHIYNSRMALFPNSHQFL